jgi:hypothetical protein
MAACGADTAHAWTRIDPTAVEALRSPAGNRRMRFSTEDGRKRLTPAD